MKKVICLLLLGVFSCRQEKKADEKFTLTREGNNAWSTYEGRVPLDEEKFLYMEVSMRPTALTDEGLYQLDEYLEENDAFTHVASSKGKYSTIYGNGPDALMIQFHNSALPVGFTRTYLGSPGFSDDLTATHLQMIREEIFRKTDLALKPQGSNKLIVLDQRLEAVAAEGEYNLVRRTSGLFTVEGYFRHNGDTADFFEMNTKEKWGVSKLGAYRQAIRQYHQLTTAKFEVTYLKGIGFSTRQTSREGKEIEALVLKKLLQMTSSPTLTDEYNREVP